MKPNSTALQNKSNLVRPFILTALIFFLDQLSKWLVVRYIEPLRHGGPIIEVLGDFLRFIHARNPGIAFSIGRDAPEPVRTVLFTVMPIAILVILLYFYLKNTDLSRFQRWCLTGILGGGVGNLADRIFRPDGVVDFIDVKFYGIFGLERWPTFNLADSAVVVCGILLAVYTVYQDLRENSWVKN
jgi:signal peptidase II